jgi:hypothetical protein
LIANLGVERLGRDLLLGLAPGDKLLDRWRQRAALDRRRIGDDAVAPLPQAGPVLGDHQPGIGIDGAQPVARPLKRFELRLVVRHFTVVRRLAGFEVELRARFVADPAAIMKHCRAH